MDTSQAPERLQLNRNGWMPNNPRLPVLLYRGALGTSGRDPGSQCEAVFFKNGWPSQWRNSIYAFHHYHSTAHEVLGFASGRARVMLGGENGRAVILQAGDVALLPAGTGHCCMEATSDLLVIGAYPRNQHWDICRKAPSARQVASMLTLPFPPSDPVWGRFGPLVSLWR